MMEDDPDIRVRKAKERGFFIEEAGSVVAAFSSRSEVANWIEDRLGEIPGEIERENQDMHDTVMAMPRVLRDRTGPRGIRGWFKGGRQ